MGLFEDCFNGTLTATQIKSHVPYSDINAQHPDKGITPLIAAVFSSQATTVRRLLEVGKANPNTPSIDGQTPLSWAASTTRKNRAQIVSLLLEHGADVDATCDAVRGETPLMLVLNETRDPDVIRLLVEAGASLDAVSKKGETVEDIARRLDSPVVNAALYPNKSRIDLGEVIRTIVGLIGIIIAWVNSETVNKVVRGVTKEMNEVVKRMHGIDGERDSELEKASNDKIWDKEPRTPAEFKASINTFVTKTGLDTFFSGENKQFLQTVAEKAADLLNDPMDPLSKPENVKTLIRVSMFQPVIYCDDSGSMLEDGRAQAQAALVERIARITTRLVPKGDGVELRFINAHGDNLSKLDAEGIRERMEALKITKGSYTQIGTGLKDKILKPLVYDQLDNKKGLVRPLLICIITDGHPENPKAFGVAKNVETLHTTMDAIHECGNRLEGSEEVYPRTCVRFLVSQIGNDKKAKEFLKALNDDTRLNDVIHVTAEKLDDRWRALRDNDRHLEEWLLQTLLAPIVDKGAD